MQNRNRLVSDSPAVDPRPEHIRRCGCAELWNAELYQHSDNSKRWVADHGGGMKLIAVKPTERMPAPLSAAELRNIADMGAMGRAILDLGIACGDLTKHDVDSLFQRRAA